MAENINLIDFKFLREYAKKLTGSTFDSDKKYLFETRLVSMAKEFHFSSITSLITHLREKGDNISLLQKNYFIDIMTTHETLFFRDKSPFEILKNFIMPDIMEQGRKNLYIYSAACSFGQEPLSIAISLLEYQRSNSDQEFKFQIIGTDISQSVINYAKDATYSQLEIDRGLNKEYAKKYFDKIDGKYVAKKNLQSKVTYQIENLLDPISRISKFDIIYCRNATIYMDQEKVRKIYGDFHSKLKPGGYFFVGHSERMTSHRDLFEYVNTGMGSVYRRK